MIIVKIRMWGYSSPVFFAFGIFVLAYGKMCGQKLGTPVARSLPVGTDLKVRIGLFSPALFA